MKRGSIALIVLGLLATFAPVSRASDPPSAEESQGKFAWAVAVWPSGREFKLEVAADPMSRWRGYRERANVPPDEGMLFVFPAEQSLAFEMKDCLVSLDMVFLDATLHVTEIARDQKPCREGDPCPPITPMRAAKYVLEVAGGISTAEGLKPGDHISILSEPALP